jgi:hypothetical protein
MHPDLLLALARARREDLLRHREFRELAYQGTSVPEGAAHQHNHRIRTRIGRILVSAGSRLAGPGQPEIELLHK